MLIIKLHQMYVLLIKFEHIIFETTIIHQLDYSIKKVAKLKTP